VGSVFYVMTLLGCAQGGASCTPVMTLPMAYASEARCLADRSTMSAAVTGYPAVEARCAAKTNPPASAQTRRDHSA
jgi:hypothetical protein